jgi:sulfite oxidase
MDRQDHALADPMPDMIIRSREPLNAEPRLPCLRETFITPQARFYIRSHGAVPALDSAQHRLHVDGLVAKPLDLSLTDLQSRFRPLSIRAVLQCAGNRRADLQAVRKTTGDPWQPGAIGHAEWTGARLADVLRAAGADEREDRHVAFTSCDTMPCERQVVPYQVSIPMHKALAREVLLAWAMNGEALSPEHGFPLRVVVPGYAGVRSAKWVAGVTVRDSAADSPIQQHDYKLVPPHMTEQTVDWDAGLTINEMPLNAAICEPEPGAVIDAGPVTVRGYAIVTGRQIARVDLSADGGRTWTQATIEPRSGGPWSWTFWHTTIDLPHGAQELIARAWDSAGQTMPAQPDQTWNFKGYLCAAWHRVPVFAG